MAGAGGPAETADVRLEQVTKRFGEVVAVDNVSLEIERGSFFALLGPSGCGKTTSLRMIGGFEEPTAGSIYLGDRDVVGLPPYKRDVNTVFQSYALFPHLTIAENVAFGLRRKGMKGKVVTGQVSSILEKVGLEGFEKRKPKQLSGGQQQRVALARALINSPRVLLLDEPLGALDLKLRKRMQLELKAIQNDFGITFVHVTHDQEEAMTMADRIAVLKDGLLQQLAPPLELYSRPANTFVARFVGSPPMNILAGTVSDGLFRCEAGTLEVPDGTPDGATTAGFRPEAATLTEPDGQPGQLQLQVFAVEPLGNEMIVAFKAGEEFLNVRVPAGAPVTAGQNCGISVPTRHLHFFNSQSGLRETGAPDPEPEIPASPLKETL
jgi:spermidine/putrescine transport system ATP-binding protein